MPSKTPTHRPALIAMFQARKKVEPAWVHAFYRSKAWLSTRAQKLRDQPLCEDCLDRGIKTFANTAHHVVELRDDRERALDQDNLRSACSSCHSRHHTSKRRQEHDAS